jgi:NAD(P)-dependent dehydrogenase (short-subunit alcohol dehydrogenase family)
MHSAESRIHVLVTGGSRGIGRAIAIGLASRGCRIALQFRDKRTAAEATLAALDGTGHEAFAADVSDPAQVEAVWNQTVSRFGRVDVLVNNAGIYELHPPLATDHRTWKTAWQRTLGANLFGPAHFSHLAANAMAHQEPRPSSDFGRGRIVNISSRGAFRGEPEAPAYGASKAGLNALGQSLARALAPQQIYVFSIAPGWVETDLTVEHLNGPRGDEIRAQHPLGRVSSADEVARAALFCALEAPPAMTGAILDINGASYVRT